MIKMQTKFQFLENFYLLGYMGLRTEDYDNRSGVFGFTPIEPPVTILSTKYLTPRGAHIFISQAGLCLVENILETEGFDMSTNEFRKLTMDGRMKIVELNQKYRRELTLDKNLQGKLNLTKIRWGKAPIVKIDFNLANRAITGNFTAILAPKSTPQMNTDIIRRN